MFLWPTCEHQHLHFLQPVENVIKNGISKMHKQLLDFISKNVKHVERLLNVLNNVLGSVPTIGRFR
jgi:hypothetical protein